MNNIMQATSILDISYIETINLAKGKYQVLDAQTKIESRLASKRKD
jgi:hypothetical protein